MDYWKSWTTPEVIDLISSNDIFGTSETWLKDKVKISIPGYKFYPVNRKVNKGATKGGVGLFIKEEIKKYVKIRYDLSSENTLWCKLDKKFFGFNNDVYIGSVYIPPETSSKEIRIKKDHYKSLIETTLLMGGDSNKILIGDFNARTHNITDTLVKEKHDKDLGLEFYSKISTIRNNKDKTVNNYGNKLIEYCTATRSYIVNGRTIGDIEGKFTCHQPGGSSTVDYAIVSEDMKKYVQSFEVLDPDTGSDHCPIKLQITCPHNLSTMGGDDTETIPPPFKWNEETKLFFTKQMNSETICKKINDLSESIDETDDVDSHVDKLNEIFRTSLEFKKCRKKTKNKKKHPHKA